MTDLRESLDRHTLPFLQGLFASDAEAAWFHPGTFQTFDDEKPSGKSRPLARIIQGPLDDHAEDLKRLNDDGAGIFVTVNQTDLKGRTKGNIRALRAWWADLDLKDAKEPFAPERLPLPPSMIVKTPGGWHLYWLAASPMPCEHEARRNEHEAELRGIQQALASFGADPKVCQVASVLRLPGYQHRKAGAHLVELVKANGPRYTREEMRQAFPPQGRKPKPEAPAPKPIPCPLDRAGIVRRAGAYLATLPGGIQGSDGSGTTLKAALKTITRFDLTEDEALSLMQSIHNPRCEPAWDEAELRHKVTDAWKLAQGSLDLGCALRDEGPAGSPVPLEAWEEDAGPPLDAPMPDEDIPWPDDEDAPPNLIKPDIEDPTRPKVRGFEWKPKGLYIAGEQPKTVPSGDTIPGKPAKWIAPPFNLPGLVRDLDSQGWRVLIAWNDLDGVPHEEAVPFELMSGEGTDLARTLAQGGMVLSPEPAPRKALLRYLCGAALKICPRVRLVDALGWHEGAFALPDGKTVGQSGEPIRFAGDGSALQRRSTAGTLEGWQSEVARHAVGEPRLAFGIASAFAGPILGWVRPDGGGGFNLQGFSSKGKSTILEAAASVWHNPAPLPTWRATSNGLEGIAASRNDGFLVLDELGQVDAKEAGPMAYMLANGSAKVRANRDGGNRALKQWRLIFLSSGEQGLEDKLSEDGKKPKAGQEVRVPDIPCPASGMLEDAHGFTSLGAFAEHLKASARKHHGHPIRAFLARLCEEWDRRPALQSKLKVMESDWMALNIPAGADAQVRRVGGRFALVAVAGELARTMEILPWPDGEAFRAAAVCFKAWLDRRGFSGASEVHKGIEGILAFLQRHGLSRFDEWGDRETRVINRAGTRKRAEGVDGWDFYITPDGWKEACQGFTPRSVAQACAEAGILEPDGSGKLSRSVKIPGHGQPRCYVIRAASLARYQESEAA